MNYIPLHQTSFRCRRKGFKLYILQLFHWVEYSPVLSHFFCHKYILSRVHPARQGRIIFQLKFRIWNVHLQWSCRKMIKCQRISLSWTFLIQLESKPLHEADSFRGLFLPPDHPAAAFTSSAACFELRSASSLCADGAWDLQASWYWNFLSIWAQSVMERL